MAKAALKTNHRQISDNRHNTKKRDSVICKLKLGVEEFLCRDDSSRVKAGKKSTKTMKKQKRQIRVLNDSLKNLHMQYLSENFERKMSPASFCRLKPFYIRHTKPSDRETCLCKRHENLTFKVHKLLCHLMS